jgi:glucan phosphoethanolaminetransferase (alkaline phosphatase superfamily)
MYGKSLLKSVSKYVRRKVQYFLSYLNNTQFLRIPLKQSSHATLFFSFLLFAFGTINMQKKKIFCARIEKLVLLMLVCFLNMAHLIIL